MRDSEAALPSRGKDRLKGSKSYRKSSAQAQTCVSTNVLETPSSVRSTGAHSAA
jgi:hypothetical protein